MKRLYLIVFGLWLLAACAFGENGPTPQVVVGSSGISDGSVTPAKISSGYNLLSDAEKTQALVGSSTVAFSASSVDASGNFTNVPGLYSAFKSRETILADDASVDLQTLLQLVGDCMGTVEVVATNGGLGMARVILIGAANTATLGENYNAASTDTDGKLCVFSAGSGNYTLKNRLGAPSTFLVIYRGRK